MPRTQSKQQLGVRGEDLTWRRLTAMTCSYEPVPLGSSRLASSSVMDSFG